VVGGGEGRRPAARLCCVRCGASERCSGSERPVLSTVATRGCLNPRYLRSRHNPQVDRAGTADDEDFDWASTRPEVIQNPEYLGSWWSCTTSASWQPAGTGKPWSNRWCKTAGAPASRGPCADPQRWEIPSGVTTRVLRKHGFSRSSGENAGKWLIQRELWRNLVPIARLVVPTSAPPPTPRLPRTPSCRTRGSTIVPFYPSPSPCMATDPGRADELVRPTMRSGPHISAYRSASHVRGPMSLLAKLPGAIRCGPLQLPVLLDWNSSSPIRLSSSASLPSGMGASCSLEPVGTVSATGPAGIRG
jgi:hypothetical protein